MGFVALSFMLDEMAMTSDEVSSHNSLISDNLAVKSLVPDIKFQITHRYYRYVYCTSRSML